MSADTATEHPQSHYLRAVFHERGFRRLLSIRMIGQIGDGFFQGGLAGSVLFNPERAADGMAIAAGFAALLLPYSLIGPYVGVLLDRWSRRSVIYLSNLLRAVFVLLVAVQIWSGDESLVLFGLALTVIGLNRFFLAGLSAATPHVVDDHMLVTANSVSSTLGSIAFSVGIGGAAALVQTVVATSFHGYALVAALAAAFYLAAALAGRVSFTADALGPSAAERRNGSVLHAVREVARGSVAGLRHLAVKRGAAYLVLVQAAHRYLYGILVLATLLLFRTVFNTGDDVTDSFGTIAQAFIAGGVGMVLAAFVTPPVARRIGGWRWVTVLLLGCGVSILAFGLPFDATLLLGAVFVINIVSQGTKIVVDTSLQHECDDDYRGRIFSVNDTAFNVMLVAGMYTGALVLPETGESVAALLVVGAAYLVVAPVYAVLGGRWARRVGDDIADPDGAPAALVTRSSSSA